VTAAATSPTLEPNQVDRPTSGTRRAPSVPARPSSSFRSLLRPTLSPAYGVEQSQSVLVDRWRAARSQRESSLSPNQRTFSYSVHLAQPIGSDIEVEYPAARLSAFQPRSVDTSTDVGRASLPFDASRAGSATGPRWPESPASVGVRVHLVTAAWPTSVDAVSVPAFAAASAYTPVRPGTPISSSVGDVTGQPGVGRPAFVDMSRGPALPTVVDVPRLLGLTPPSFVDIARPSAVDRCS